MGEGNCQRMLDQREMQDVEKVRGTQESRELREKEPREKKSRGWGPGRFAVSTRSL